MSEIVALLQQVFCDVFEDDGLEITRNTTAADVDGWDSLMHVTLVVNIEKAFGIKLTSREIASFQCVGDLVDLVAQRLSA